MAEYSFPHDAVIGEDGQPDRVYYAEDWRRMLQHYFTNGLFPNPSTNLQVQSLNSNMVVTVQPGYGHVKGCTYTNDEPLEFALDTANANYNRIDLIVLRLDDTERTLRVLYKPGTAASNPIAPELTRNDDVWELKLAQITVRSGTQVISTSDITDTRLSDECGIVACIPDQVETGSLFEQYEAKWLETLSLMEQHEMDYQAWYEGFKSAAAEELQNRYDNWDKRITEFDTWFSQNKATIFDAKYFDFENWTYRAGETKKTTFNADGSIIEKIVNTISSAEIAKKETRFEANGDITEHLTVPELEIDVTKMTIFQADGGIDEVIT